MTISLPAITIVALVLLIVGLGVFIGGIIAGILRVGRQYSSAMVGNRGLRVGVALSTAGRLWVFGLLAVIGTALLVAYR